MLHFHYGMCLIAIVSLWGCAANPREASPGSIAQSVKESVTVVGQYSVWRSPALQVSHYRTLFYGYDSVYYWLVARKSPKGGALYEMSIAADYGGDLRHYDAVKFADGSIRPMVNQQHDTERCQFFNSLVYACLFHDRASLELSQSELEAARLQGLRLTLSSGKQEYEIIDLPANYIQGFLQAVQ
jgi:transcriptional antiterminator Rof (Rho-off)